MHVDSPTLLRGPGPAPPEWRYPYERHALTSRAIPAICAAAALVLLLALTGAAAYRKRGRLVAAAVLLAACLGGSAFQWGLFRMGGDRQDGALATIVRRTYSPYYTSYFWVAVSPEQSPRRYLQNHTQTLLDARTGPNHASTHPPGPVLYCRGLIDLFDAYPRLTIAFLNALSRLGVDWRAFATPRAPAWARQPNYVAAAVFGGTSLILLGILACIPITLVARLVGADLPGAVRIGVLWVLVPALDVMSPQFDQVLAFLVAWSWALMALAATRQRAVNAVILAVGAGVAGGMALFVSYGAAVFLALAGTVALVAARGAKDPVRRVVLVTGLAGGTALLLFLAPALAGNQPFLSFAMAVTIHMETFTRQRSHLMSVLYNALDTFFFLGPPILLLGAIRLSERVRAMVRDRDLAHIETRQLIFLVAVAGAVLLDVAGITRGETGRIWMPLMPMWLTVILVQRPPGHAEEAASWPPRGQCVLCAALLVVMSVTMKLSWLV